MERVLVHVALAAAIATLAAGCGGGTPEHRQEPAPPLQLRVYLLRSGAVQPVARRVRTRSAPRAALLQLLAGPSTAERAAGLTSGVHGRLALTVAGGVATVRGRLASRPARAQVVYTLTQFPEIRRVVLGDSRPLRRADFERETPPLLVESPLPGAHVSSPLRIRGTANAFEATFQAELVDGRGVVLAHRTVMATSGSGQRGTFDTALTFTRRGAGRLVVYENSAADGSRIHQVSVPLELRP